MRFYYDLLPPNMNFFKAKKCVQIIAKCQSKDIPEEVKITLLDILKYNEGRDVNEDGRRFLQEIKFLLKKVEQEKFEKEKSRVNHKDHPVKKKEQVKGIMLFSFFFFFLST